MADINEIMLAEKCDGCSQNYRQKCKCAYCGNIEIRGGGCYCESKKKSGKDCMGFKQYRKISLIDVSNEVAILADIIQKLA